MDEAVATLILSSLCERSLRDQLPITLTSAELAAIQRLFGAQDQQSRAPNVVVTPEAVKTEQPFSPVISWHPDSKPDEQMLLCLDFGTSLSKAFICENDDPDEVPRLLDVTFGVDSDGNPQFFLPSELFIQDNYLHFGAAARRTFDLVEASQDRLIDNPKQYMTLGTDVTNLHQKLLRPEQDPSKKLSQRDVLVLYLAHLNRMADMSLQAGSRLAEVRRRYTHPAWEKGSEKANGDAMARIMSEAIALARLFPADFEEKTPLDRAAKMAIAARGADDAALPYELLREPVREATAAGAGALIATDLGKRQAFVILDIGAGTTDVAGCVCIKNKLTGQLRVTEVTTASKALAQAGNRIDNALLKQILDSSSLAEGTTEYDRTLQSLRKTIRALKESLFDDGFLLVPLATGETVEIELSVFLGSPFISKFFGKINDIVAEAAFAVAGSETTVFLVPTGGGSRLPIVDMLLRDPLYKDGKSVQLRLREAMPADLKAPYPGLQPFYPQLAVAIGGALPSLPIQVNSINEGISDPGKKTLSPVYRSPHA